MGNPFALLVGMQTSAATVESSMEIPQKIKNGPFDPVKPLLEIYVKEPRTLIEKNIKLQTFFQITVSGFFGYTPRSGFTGT